MFQIFQESKIWVILLERAQLDTEMSSVGSKKLTWFKVQQKLILRVGKLKIQETFKWNIEKSHLARTLDSYYGQYDEEAVICTLKGDQASLEKRFKTP